MTTWKLSKDSLYFVFTFSYLKNELSDPHFFYCRIAISKLFIKENHGSQFRAIVSFPMNIKEIEILR